MATSIFRAAIITFFLSCACVMPVQAATTNTLWNLKASCISATALNGGKCNGYIDGVIRAYWATAATLKQQNIRLESFCTPKSDTPDMQNSDAYVRKYIMSHPGDDQRDAALVIFEALREAYGCQ